MNTKTNVIVVGIDLSEPGGHALAQAHAWAERSDSVLCACHALPDPGPIETLLGTLDQSTAGAADRMSIAGESALASYVERIIGKPVAEHHVAFGSPHRLLVAEAQARGANLIVVGATSKTTTERLLLGSTADQVVRHAHASVLVTRPERGSGRVLVATDLSDLALPAVAEAAAESARRGAQLTAMHALDLAHPILSGLEPAVVVDAETTRVIQKACHETLTASLSRFGATGETMIVEGPPERAIVSAAESMDADLLVVGTHGHHGVTRFALGSVAARVVKRAPCSVLVVRA